MGNTFLKYFVMFQALQKKSRIREKSNFSTDSTKMFNSETTSFQRFSPRIPNLLKFWTSNFGKWGQNRLQNILHEKGTSYNKIQHTDIATTRSNRPSGLIQWKLELKYGYSHFKSANYDDWRNWRIFSLTTS